MLFLYHLLVLGPCNRGIGIDDDIAPSVERPDDSLALYDLFRDDGFEYIGTTRAPDLISRPWCGQCALSASWLTTARGVSNSSMADKPIGFALRSLDVSVTKWQIHPTASILRLLPTDPPARRSIK